MKSVKETSTHGGTRPGAGRKPTGRKRQSFSVTDEEYIKLKECLAALRSNDNPQKS